LTSDNGGEWFDETLTGEEADPDDLRFIPSQQPLLDATDLGIARALERNGRMSVLELSRKLGVSRATISERLTRLIEQGVIKGFHARLDYKRLGYPLLAFIGLQSVQGFNVVEVVSALKRIREVEEVHTVTGRIDMLVKLRARSTEHLQYILTFKIQAIPGIGRGETMLVLSSGLEWAPVGWQRQMPASAAENGTSDEAEPDSDGPHLLSEDDQEAARQKPARRRARSQN
jgi:DNA-binding Lrp family transcriptional regulator